MKKLTIKPLKVINNIKPIKPISTKPPSGNKGVDYRKNDIGGRKHKQGYGY